MADPAYAPPVDQLLTYGKGELTRTADEWPDYVAKAGLGPEHIPALIRMATDEDLSDGDEDDAALWGPVHAWRALGQMRAEVAIKPLLALLEWDDDWATEEVPEVYGLIGPVAIPTLAGYLAGNHKEFPLIHAAAGLKAIALRHPEAREAVVAALLRQLEMFAANDETLNGFLISDLVDLKAVEAAPIMEQAFAAHAVDEMIMGDWEEVRYALGLRATPPERERGSRPFMPGFGPFGGFASGGIPKPARKPKAAKKSQAKLAKESRRKNRKRK